MYFTNQFKIYCLSPFFPHIQDVYNDILKSATEGQIIKESILAENTYQNVLSGELETNQLKPVLKIQWS